MRRLTHTLVTLSAASAAFVGGLTVAGQFGATPPGVLVPQSASGPDALTRFDSCDELLEWYVARNLPDVGPYGWENEFTGYTVAQDDGSGSASAPSAAPLPRPGAEARTSSETGTNTQELGVDEPDTAKTDGRLVVHVADRNRLVVTDVSGDRPRELGSLDLPEDLWAPELLLVGDHVLVTSLGQARAFAGDVVRPYPAGVLQGRLLDVDISAPDDPRLLSTSVYDGGIESVRQYGDVVRVVTEKPRPELAWVTPKGDVSEDEARSRNRSRLRASTIEDWLPSVEVRSDDPVAGVTAPLPVDCADVHRPPVDSGASTLGVFTWPVGGNEIDSLAVVADAEVVYSSPDRLYVATSGTRPDIWRAGLSRLTGRRIAPPEVRTQVHAFGLDGSRTSYLASGHVDGTVRDRWSLDEQDGRLRVAYARFGAGGGTRDNAVAVLDADLAPVGQVAGLGIDEEIQSVRWFDDFAVVVTFRQVDPLYTISFDDPRRPRLLGELKISGFSAYLHPLGDGRLLGLGQDATLQGQRLGAQAAVFDIGTLTDPRQAGKHQFPEGTELLAGSDPRAFTWVPGTHGGTAYTLLRRGWWGPVPMDTAPSSEPVPPERDAGLRVVAVDVVGDRLSVRVLDGAADERTRVLPIDGGRVVLVGPGVRLLP